MKVTAKWLALMLLILEVSAILTEGFRGFSSVSPGKFRDCNVS
jgi:hypothetical protein